MIYFQGEIKLIESSAVEGLLATSSAVEGLLATISAASICLFQSISAASHSLAASICLFQLPHTVYVSCRHSLFQLPSICCPSGELVAACGVSGTRRAGGRCAGGVLLSRLSGAVETDLGWADGFGGGSVARHALLAPLMRSAGLRKMSRMVLTALL